MNKHAKTFVSTTNRMGYINPNGHWEVYNDGKATGIVSDSINTSAVTTTDQPKKTAPNPNLLKELGAVVEYELEWSWRYGTEYDNFSSKKQLSQWWDSMCNTYDEKALSMKQINVKRRYIIEA